MNNDSEPTLVVGRLELQPQITLLHSLSPDHRAETLLYQQKVAALIECARDYAHSPHDVRVVEELFRVAAQFTDEA